MNEAVLRLALDSKDIFKLVISRSKILSSMNGDPAQWEYTLYSSRRWALAYKAYNQAINLPDVYEVYMLDIMLPSVFVEKIPLGSLTPEILQQLQAV